MARAKSLYQFNLQRKETLENEIRRLKLLKFASRREFRYEVARVVRRDLNAWWQQIVIRKGKDFDIPVVLRLCFQVVSLGVSSKWVHSLAVSAPHESNFRMAANGVMSGPWFTGLPQSGAHGNPLGAVHVPHKM